MRDILAALLRDRGYRHNDETDPTDQYWQADDLGVRPLLVCVEWELNKERAKKRREQRREGVTT